MIEIVRFIRFDRLLWRQDFRPDADCENLLLIVILILSHDSYGQVKNSSLKSDSLKMVSEPPLEFSLDAGYYTGDYDVNTLILAVNVKIIRNKLFAMIEYGGMFDKNFNSDGEFVSLSADYRILNLRKSSLDYYVGVAGSINPDGIAPVMGARYLYKVNKNFGLLAGLKFFDVTRDGYPIVSIGVSVK